MAWNKQGGPWGGGGGGQGPWGGGGPGRPGGGGGGGMQPPDLEETLRRAQERVKRFMPGGSGGAKGIVLVLIAVIAIWLGSGFYRVQPEQQGVELLFGQYVQQTQPGLNYWLPSPIGTVYTPNVTRVNTIQIGYRGEGGATRANRDVPSESLMLTGDQNVVDIDFDIQWQIKDAAFFLFNIRDPEGTVKIAAESALREVVGQATLENVLTTGRQKVEADTQVLLQKILDDYGAGILITQTKLQVADPPQEVIDAFNDVQRARQDQERLVNEANAYKNDIVPRAKGEAEKRIAAAKAYKEQVIKEAEGEAARFLSVFETYQTAKDVTTRRLFLERMQDVLRRSNKIIIDKGVEGGQGVVPYLPLNELQKRGGSQ
ncbi:MAG: FtsH protease activity modulator HflK [Rhodospirillales bacterium]|nr:FtsH protease activity modulator HflK [Rhodospirillales bacterium]MBO6787146.1 FtsH protease activity modulator HflK [Rhodospirillales bacterium]